MVTEFPVSEDFVTAHQVGEVLDTALLDGATSIAVTGFSKGKGFQGMVKRCNIK